MTTLKHMGSETYRTYIFLVFAVFGYIINLYYLACVCVCLFSSLLISTALFAAVFPISLFVKMLLFITCLMLSMIMDQLWVSVGDPDPNPDPSDPYVLGLLDPDPFVRGMDPDQAKIVRKTLIPTVL